MEQQLNEKPILSSRQKTKLKQAQLLVELFNDLYSVGDLVELKKVADIFSSYQIHKLKYKAFVSYSLEPVAFFEGISGYFSIDPSFISYKKIIKFSCSKCDCYCLTDPGPFCENCQQNSFKPVYEDPNSF